MKNRKWLDINRDAVNQYRGESKDATPPYINGLIEEYQSKHLRALKRPQVYEVWVWPKLVSELHSSITLAKKAARLHANTALRRLKSIGLTYHIVDTRTGDTVSVCRFSRVRVDRLFWRDVQIIG